MKWLYGILCLIFLIIFHEFGHFIAAKIFGVKVESFSVGFGPILLHKKFRGTDYRISLLPLGGYCGMKGENDFRKAIEEDLSEIQAEKDSLYGVHPIKRALIGFAGPFFNFIFAFLAFSFIYGIGFYYYTYSNKIILSDEVMENVTTTVARDAGLKTGDYIIKIDDVSVSDFDEIKRMIATRPEEEIQITILRDNQELTFTVIPELNKELGYGIIGITIDESEQIIKESEHFGFFGSLKKGFLDCIDTVSITFKGIAILFKGVNIDNVISGPIRATELLGDTVKYGMAEGFRQGLVGILQIMAFISMSLCIMNLLPIPVLDGGLILVALIEFITRKKVKPKIQYYIQFIGIAFILVLAFIGLKGDIIYLIKKLRG